MVVSQAHHQPRDVGLRRTRAIGDPGTALRTIGNQTKDSQHLVSRGPKVDHPTCVDGQRR